MALPTHLNIVALETFFTPLPPLTVPSPHTFTLTSYNRTTPAELPSRIQDAHILITCIIPLRADALSAAAAPNLRLVVVLASGTDSVDLATCRARGIRVLNSPGCNADAVAEHAVALYFAARRSLVPTMADLRAGEWPRRGSLMTRAFAAGAAPRGCRDETAVVVGYGAVGRRVEALLSALGMRVVIAARKSAAAAAANNPPSSSSPSSITTTDSATIAKPKTTERVPFEEALKMATVLVLCCPRTPDTLHMISEPQLATMRADAVIVNVARGGVVVEEALLAALREGKIAGAAVDVFDAEPAGPDTSPLLEPDAVQGLNLVTTPHMAWIGMDTNINLQRALQENIEGFLVGKVAEERVRAFWGCHE
ncbi:hypothetical protein SLS62_008433 [Diatrype stigma]|uniref:Glycerate dehydrogenase n=1 Tax=Diatrype stigma TaxID=117547 RepID=A0AAN9UJJ5_9PEZI